MSRREFASKLPTDLACVLHSAKVSPTPFTLRKKAEGPYFEPKIPGRLFDYGSPAGSIWLSASSGLWKASRVALPYRTTLGLIVRLVRGESSRNASCSASQA